MLMLFLPLPFLNRIVLGREQVSTSTVPQIPKATKGTDETPDQASLKHAHGVPSTPIQREVVR